MMAHASNVIEEGQDIAHYGRLALPRIRYLLGMKGSASSSEDPGFATRRWHVPVTHRCREGYSPTLQGSSIAEIQNIPSVHREGTKGCLPMNALRMFCLLWSWLLFQATYAGAHNVDELKAIFAYLKTIRPVKNISVQPTPPVLAAK